MKGAKMDDYKKIAIYAALSSAMQHLADAAGYLVAVSQVDGIEDEEFINVSSLNHALVRLSDTMDALVETAPPSDSQQERIYGVLKEQIAILRRELLNL